MKRKEYLEKRISELTERLNSISEKVKASEDAKEVRALTAQAEELRSDITAYKEELSLIGAEKPVEGRDKIPSGATKVNASFNTPTQKRGNESVLTSAEYRNAFRGYVCKGSEIPAEFRDGLAINASGVPIPVTIMNEVINTVRKRYGNLYNKVRKTSVPGGVKYPIGALNATFKWINESTVSPRQKVGDVGYVTFEYNTAEIRISQTFLANLLSLEAFEAKISEIIAVAYLQAMDYGIVNGSGNGTMLGILNDTRITNTVTMTAKDMGDWTAWRKKFFSALPLGYRSGEFIFPVSTVDSYLETMADSNNNPIFRQATGLEVNDGDSLNPNGRFFGRNIALVEEDIIADFDTASAGDVIGIYWQPEEYAINENFGFSMRRYFDEETNEWVDKAIVVVDGKVLNPNGFVKIIKG